MKLCLSFGISILLFGKLFINSDVTHGRSYQNINAGSAEVLESNIPNDSSLKLVTDFEGASANVIFLDAHTQTVRITPAGKAERGMPTWWYFRLDHIDQNKPVIIEVVQNDVVLTAATGKTQRLSGSWTWPTNATYSTDKKNWRHTAAGEKLGNKMVYRIQPESNTIWIAWGPPFTPADAHHFVEQVVGKHSFAKSFILSQTREGRSVPAIRISEGNKPLAHRPAIWIHARQHAWEVGSSWVATGFAQWVIGDSDDAKWLRQNTEIYIVPIMDIDHVATGDGGKHAQPRDHNRDWTATPHYPEIAATQQRILSLAKEGRMSILLDLHNPGPGTTLEAFYILNKAYIDSQAVIRQVKFMELAREQFGEVTEHDAKPPLQNPDIFYTVCDVWVATHANPHTIAICVETPWNITSSTVEGYADVGAKLGKIVHKLLKEEVPVEQFAKVEDGLYYGKKRGLLGTFDYYVIIENDNARTEHMYERGSNIIRDKSFSDTMIRQNDSLFAGKKYALEIYNNRMFLVNRENEGKRTFKVELVRSDEKIKQKWDSRNNRLRLYEINDEYDSARYKLTDQSKKDNLIRAYGALQRKVNIDQQSFLKELSVFKNEFLQ